MLLILFLSFAIFAQHFSFTLCHYCQAERFVRQEQAKESAHLPHIYGDMYYYKEIDIEWKRKGDTEIDLSPDSYYFRNNDTQWQNDICDNNAIFRACARTQKINIKCPREIRISPNDTYLIRERRGSIKMVPSIGKNANLNYKIENTTISVEANLVKQDCYYCWATHAKSSGIYLSAAFSPSYYECSAQKNIAREERAIGIGDNVTFQCWENRLEENATVEWYFREQLHNVTTGLTYHAFGNWLNSLILDYDTNVLSLVNVSEAFSGKYKCIVWFDESKYRYVKEFDLQMPKKPIDLTITRSDTRATLAWKKAPTTIANLTSNSFKVLYYRVGRQKIDKPITATTNETSLTLVNLSPNTLYLAEVRQLTEKYGESEAATILFLTKTTNNTVSKYDQEVKVRANESATLKCYNYENVKALSWWRRTEKERIQLTYSLSEFYWNPHSSNDQHLQIREDKISKRQFMDLDILNKTYPLNVGSGYTHTIDRVDLTKIGIYECQVPFDEGRINHVFTIGLFISELPKPPANLTCQNTSNGNFMLRWTDSNQKTVDDSFYSDARESYLIRYKKINTARKWNQKTAAKESREAKLDNVTAGLYMVFLSAVNQAGESDTQAVTCVV